MKKQRLSVVLLLLLVLVPLQGPANVRVSLVTDQTVADVLLMSEDNRTLGTVVYRRAEGNALIWTLSFATGVSDSGYYYLKSNNGNWTRGSTLRGLSILSGAEAYQTGWNPPQGNYPYGNNPYGNYPQTGTAPPWEDNTQGGVSGTFDTGQLSGWRSGYGYQYVLFGRYQQEYANQPILWRILGIQNGRALLLSEWILDTIPFDADSNNWETSDLKAWLNSTFYWTAFTQAERYAITYNGSTGNIFIPSDAELCRADYGFQTDKYDKDSNRSAAGTAYAYSHNLWHPQSGEHSNYFARSNPNSTNVDLIASSGKMVLAKITRDNVGVRPAVWVDIGRLPLLGGRGTMQEPFQ